jgi:DoxX-like family
MNRALWMIQGLLALLFLFAGGVKLVLPIEEMTKQMPMLSGSFLRFVGVCEVLGGFGLILPGLLRIQQWLTPLAAACLVVITIGATVVTLMTGGGSLALFPFATGLWLVFVAYGRWRMAPHRAAVNA